MGYASIGSPMGGEEDLLAEAQAVLERIARDRRAMLERIGAAPNVGNPEAVYIKLIAESGSATTREKLARAWAAAGQAHVYALTEAVDGILAARPRRDEPCGCVEKAVVAQEKLAWEVRAVTGAAHHPMAHFRFALRTVFGEVPAPSFAMDECMAFIANVAWEEFGVSLHGSGRGRVSFWEARGLFRRVGEAVGRLMGDARCAGAWFEKWAYHPEFAGDYGRLQLAEHRGGLVERAVAAALQTDVREHFALLDRRFGVGRFCSLSDVASRVVRERLGPAPFALHPKTQPLRLWVQSKGRCCERPAPPFYEAAGLLDRTLQP